MNAAVLVLLLINFGLIGLLPVLFFRRDGTFNLRWCLTALPFCVAVAMVISGWLGFLSPLLAADSPLLATLQVLAVPLSAASIGLMCMTISAHRVPLALWHQDNDDPSEIVTWGPYARVRHPFYSSFLLAFGAVLLLFPHYLTALLLGVAFVSLKTAALREEHRLEASQFGSTYTQYMAHTGCFVPRVGRTTHDE